MSDLSDFKRMVYEPETRWLRERNQKLKAAIEQAIGDLEPTRIGPIHDQALLLPDTMKVQDDLRAALGSLSP